MLEIVIPEIEMYDEKENQFFYTKRYTLQLEHSLLSLSKWESRWCKPFLSKTTMTIEESIDYIRCMTLTQNVDPAAYSYIRNPVMQEVTKYIEAPMTATVFSKTTNHKLNREIVTAEIIYYWMIALGIPFECQKWHLNRLLTLINVCNIKNHPQKKMSKRELFEKNRALNAARRGNLNSSG